MAKKKKTLRRRNFGKVVGARLDNLTVLEIDRLARRDFRERGQILRMWIVERVEAEIAKEAEAKA